MSEDEKESELPVKIEKSYQEIFKELEDETAKLAI